MLATFNVTTAKKQLTSPVNKLWYIDIIHPLKSLITNTNNGYSKWKKKILYSMNQNHKKFYINVYKIIRKG